MKEKRREQERVLTKSEQRRAEKIQALIDEKTAVGYRRKDLTISVGYANAMALLLGTPLCLLYTAAFYLFCRGGVLLFSMGGYLLLLAAVAASVVLHELIHGLFWGLFAKGRFQSIEFGFIKKYLTPYCTCLEPLSRAQYMVGSAMPGVLLGVVPMTVSLFTGSIWLLVYGIVMTFSAGGDFTVILRLLRYRADGEDVIYLDHPTECGLIVLERPSAAKD